MESTRAELEIFGNFSEPARVNAILRADCIQIRVNTISATACVHVKRHVASQKVEGHGNGEWLDPRVAHGRGAMLNSRAEESRSIPNKCFACNYQAIYSSQAADCSNIPLLNPYPARWNLDIQNFVCSKGRMQEWSVDIMFH